MSQRQSRRAYLRELAKRAAAQELDERSAMRASCSATAIDTAATGFLRALQTAGTFVDVAILACNQRGAIGVADLTVALLDTDGQVTIRVDTATSRPDLRDVARAIVAGHAAIRTAHGLAIPLVEPSGILGYVYGHAAFLSDKSQHGLHLLASFVSVRLVQLGVTTNHAANTLPRLGVREREVAELVCSGLTNLEISRVTRTSINTIKKQLKTVYARLDVANRAELVSRLHRAPPPERVRPGVTQLGTLWVTRAGGTHSGHRRCEARIS